VCCGSLRIFILVKINLDFSVVVMILMVPRGCLWLSDYLSCGLALEKECIGTHKEES
jgi:hypothetical protein